MELEEEKMYGPLKAFQDISSFRLPEGYLAGLQDKMAGILKEENAAATLPERRHCFRVPSGYFDTMQEELMPQLRLRSLSDSGSMILPDGYLASLPGEVLPKTGNGHRGGSVIPAIFRSSAVWRVAAMLVLVTGIFLLRQESSPAVQEFSLSQIDDDSLMEYLAENEHDLTAITSQLDEFEIPATDILNDSETDAESLDEIIENYQ